MVKVSDALEKLAADDPDKANLVKLHCCVGLTLEESARALGIAEPTARRWRAYARAWLFNEVHGRPTQPERCSRSTSHL